MWKAEKNTNIKGAHLNIKRGYESCIIGITNSYGRDSIHHVHEREESCLIAQTSVSGQHK